MSEITLTKIGRLCHLISQGFNVTELINGMERHRCIQDIAKAGLEGISLSSLFRYAKIKGNALFFVFKSDAAKFEFKYKKEHILEQMRAFYKVNKERLQNSHIVFIKIEACVIAEPKKEPVKKSTLDFKEQSSGDFDITCNDPALRALFVDIQKTIKEKSGK